MVDSLKQTPLHSSHLEQKARMVDFGGWSMPVQFEGILAEHKSVREQVGIFDVSHMGEVDFIGAGAEDAIQKLITNDAKSLVDGKALYTTVCLPSGGIVDDCIVYRHSAENFRIVVNASNIEKDFQHFRDHAGSLCDIQNHSDETALIAVQGPVARQLVADLSSPDAMNIGSFHFAPLNLAGKKVVAARTGYTGEDGFELFVDAQDANTVWNALLEKGAKPIGLGARDTLRLEAKLCLYGNDIDESTTPYEACLGWTVKLDKGDFVGRDKLAEQKSQGVERKLVGFKILDRGIARAGAEVVDESGAVVGKVTSGSTAPTVGGAVGIAYVPTAMAKAETKIQINQRGKTLQAEIVKGPFYRRPA